MLERMRLRNFQCHRDFRIVFDPRVTTLVGSSDLGKSSVLRALRWILTNKPMGTAFVRHGEKTTVGTLWLDDRKLIRRKGKGVNELCLDGCKLEAFNREVPESVQRLCNVDDGNFQGQHDPPFWLSLSAGQAGRELNAVVDLEKIDDVQSAVLKMERAAEAEVSVCKRHAEDAARENERLSWVPEMEEQWDRLEQKRLRLGKQQSKLLLAEKLMAEMASLEEQAEMAVPDIEELERGIEQLRRKEAELKKASRLLKDVARMRDEVEDCEEGIDELQMRLSEETGGICPLCGGEWNE